MAERSLNFNAPLLSTRRIHKTAVSVRTNKTHDSVPLLVPPEMGLDQFTEAASVPFTWEQAPGILKGSHDSRPQQVFTPCLPPGKVMSKKSEHVEEEEEEEEESEDVFSDARDTLSPFSTNHSITGVSGYGVVETKKTLRDPLSRDFMLNRFLPAAKAMTVEQPHYGSNRKPSSFMPEPTIQIRELVPEEKRQTPNRYDESTLYDDEESDEDDEVSEYAYPSTRRGCGMLCFKESVAMINRVHGQVKSSKVAQLKSRFQSVKKLAIDSVSKHKLGPNMSNLTCDASRSLSPYRHTRCMSPFRNSSCFHDTRKETESLRADRLKKHIRNISWSQELLYSKGNGSTVYVDTENVDQNNSSAIDSSEEADKVGKKLDDNIELGKIKNGCVRSPLAPPSPKKPSESWLLHNLPSVTRRYTLHPKKQSFNENSRNVSKWETIVKTSYMHRDNIKYSEELVAHTSVK